MTYRHSTTPSPRTDYADAVAENLRLARTLATTQVDDFETVRRLIDKQRQCLMAASYCSDPLVLAAADTERPDPIESLKSDTEPLYSADRDNRVDR